MLDQLTRIGAKVEIGGQREVGTPKILAMDKWHRKKERQQK